LGQLEKANPARSPILIHQILDQLRALIERIEEVQRQSQVNSTDARDRLESILHRPEYQSKEKGSGVLARLLRDFFRWLESLFPKRAPLQPERANSITTILSYVVLGVCLIVIVYGLRLLLLRFVRDQKTKHKEKPRARVVLGERIAPEKSSRDLLSEAEQLAREGKLRAAIRKAYIALLLELGDRNAISLAQNKTNRDYLRSVQHVPTLYTNLNGVTDSFERHWYGDSQATQEDWQQFRSAYLETLKGER
jgi:TolA-binding protein